MPLDKIMIANIPVCRFILGSNPFCGFSHQTPQKDMEMKRYFTTAKIKETIRDAESHGIDTMIARTDFHVMRLLLEYHDEGGGIQWFAQTCPEVADIEVCVERASTGGALACHIHGGVMDNLFARNELGDIPKIVDMIRGKKMAAGIAAHNPEVISWAEKNLDVDYYLCSYYNAAHRDKKAEYISGMCEWFLEEDRRIMADLIQTLSKPVIHYKIMAAGRNDPKEAFAFAVGKMKSGDALCVGVYTRNKPDMLKQDVSLFQENWNSRQRPLDI